MTSALPACHARTAIAQAMTVLLALHSGQALGQSLPDSEIAEHATGTRTLDTVIVKAVKVTDGTVANTSVLRPSDLAPQRIMSSDSSRLLQDVQGVSLYGAGGISSLPVIRGLADDRLRVQVDGMDLMSACPNHMNSPLSYINPSKVGSVTVYAGITPVSIGGDSIGGTIQMKSEPPRFAGVKEPILVAGQAGTYYRSNGEAWGYNVEATLAGEKVSVTYSESHASANNYSAARDFKAAGLGDFIRTWLDGKTVGSSAYYDSINRDIGFALRHETHLLQLNVSQQEVGFEGFPNQRMDMTANKNTQVNLRYTGQYEWGELEARLFDQDTDHKMDMGPDRFFYGFGMPMNSKAKTQGAGLKASIELSEKNIFRIGSEYQRYRLDDWWPPVGGIGMMAPNDFWNVREGKRDRIGIFGELETRWSQEWLSLFGLRSDIVTANAGKVQGYNTAGIWRNESTAFNQLNLERTDKNLDITALTRYSPNPFQTYELGFAQKTRSPNLYERYPWSTNAMAALMNNFVGDGNGYIGNPDLKPEVAYTIGGTADWHDADRQIWGLKTNLYLTEVDDFIDARRCDFGQCGATNPTRTNSFVLLQYVNQDARLYGLDISAHRLLAQGKGYGSFTGTGIINYVRGKNRTTGNDLYHIMPLNAKLALVHRLSGWTNSAEVQIVAAKKKVSQVRNEVPTDGYTLINLRSSYEWKHARIDFAIENVFNKFYELPLGGAYVGQGASMSTNTIPWGVTVPGMGRSLNVALNLRF